ncbi:hypothetical protein RCL_jg19413.t1 [Rhizophagus clarus]|uniref:Uncharacterized protein n=1 Tax=Rhizophagus clarus TaxID=94130 RepID=A0A8H3LUA7_9GLOM|nr:hypothetical protein RCL_jg19413.t1 [Rhizophagus clarus]
METILQEYILIISFVKKRLLKKKKYDISGTGLKLKKNASCLYFPTATNYIYKKETQGASWIRFSRTHLPSAPLNILHRKNISQCRKFLEQDQENLRKTILKKLIKLHVENSQDHSNFTHQITRRRPEQIYLMSPYCNPF